MSDKLVFDLSQEIEGSPNVFIRKDWLNILDNQNQNYNNNQSVIDTSQLSNSNKWMNYREAYFLIPFVLSLGRIGAVVPSAETVTDVGTPSFLPDATTGAPTTVGTISGASPDSIVGLKNWFGQIIHSFTLDYNGTTIIQQTPFINMWNSFKLLTSLSYGDLLIQGDVIGFYPDDATSWEFNWSSDTATPAPSVAVGFENGNGICNNTVLPSANQSTSSGTSFYYNSFNSGEGNIGIIKRSSGINFDLSGKPSSKGNNITTNVDPSGSTLRTNLYSSLISVNSMNNLWKSYVFNKQSSSAQTAIMATVYLKHVHSFFNMVPLLKGVFMKMTMNLNNTSVNFTATTANTNGTAETLNKLANLSVQSVSNPLGGVNPIMINAPLGFNSVGATSGAGTKIRCGSFGLFPQAVCTGDVSSAYASWVVNLSVGSRCLNSSLVGLSSPAIQEATLSKSVYLYIPAYTFNPPFEQAYLSSPTKVIKYTDVYQYQILNVAGSNGQINNLVTNGIANIKSVLIVPFYSTASAPSQDASGIVAVNSTFSTQYGGATISANTGFTNGIPVYQSPFDPAGTGATSPLCFITNFNVQISGQNAIYNTQKYNHEQFNNQLYGQNSVNGGLTDGLCSGLIGRSQFDMEYCYYYVNVERMLPVEESVPKSVQIIGTNQSVRALDLFVFVEYGCSVSIDALTGARV